MGMQLVLTIAAIIGFIIVASYVYLMVLVDSHTSETQIAINLLVEKIEANALAVSQFIASKEPSGHKMHEVLTLHETIAPA